MRRLGVVAFVLALLWVAFARVAPVQDHVTTSFAGYWVVAREVLAGTPAAQLYDDAFLATRMAAHGVPMRETFLGPPTLALTLAPFAHLSHEGARRAWLWAVTLPCLAVSLWSLRREAGSAWVPAAMLLSPAVTLNVEVGQVYAVMLALHVVALRAAQAGSQVGMALSAAPMLVMRGWYGLPLALGWAWRGQVGASAGAVAGAGALALCALPWTGLAAWEHFLLRQLPEAASSPWAGTSAFQTLRSLCLHLTTRSPLWGPDPPIDAPRLAPWLFVGAAAGVVALVARATRCGDPTLTVALLTATELVLAPFAQEYHYVLAGLPTAVAWGRARDVLGYGLVVAGIALLSLPWDVQSPELAGGWRSLAAYPRLGGIGLVGAALLRSAR